MRRALIDPENSFLRNTIGVILFIPITLFAMLAVLPLALFERPSKTTAKKAAVYISEFLEGKGGTYDWDDFISIKIANPELDSIRVRAS